MHKSATQEALEALPSIPQECGDAVFAEPWEARAFAMAVGLNEQGLFTWPEWAEKFSANLKSNDLLDDPLGYYQVWMATLEEMVASKGIASDDARQAREQEWLAAAARTPHGKAIEL